MPQDRGIPEVPEIPRELLDRLEQTIKRYTDLLKVFVEGRAEEAQRIRDKIEEITGIITNLRRLKESFLEFEKQIREGRASIESVAKVLSVLREEFTVIDRLWFYF